MSEKKSIEKIESYARLALPLMSKHSVPLTPRNYAVWYEYVSGDNIELQKTIDTMLEEKQEFTEEKNEILYGRFCAESDEAELRKLTKDLQQVLVTVLGEVTDLSGQTEKYDAVVSKSVDKLSEDASVQEIKSVVSEIIDETKEIGKSGKAIKEKLKETTEELKTLQQEFEQAKTAAQVDFLTGVANRRAFDETLAASSDQADSDGSDLCLLMIDIDHFKKFNDEHGHLIGDEVLKFVTKKIKTFVRGGDFLARFGGEEFAVILPRTPLPGARTVAEHIRAFFSQATLKAATTSQKLGVLTVSIGAARYRPGESAGDFVNRSDQALYLAKNTGRNRVATEADLENQVSNHTK